MIQLLIQSTVLCGLTWLACQVLNQTAAAWQQKLIGFCLLMCLALPLINWIPVELTMTQAWSPPIRVDGISADVVSEAVPSKKTWVKQAVKTPVDSMHKSDPLNLLMWVWLVGSSVVLLQRSWAFYRLWQIKHRAAFFQAYQNLDVLVSKDVEVPILCAIGKTVVLIPDHMQHWDTDQLNHVLAHESCHHQRKDHWILWLSVWASTIYWFHPLVHALNRKLQQQTELACDQQVLSQGVEPISYAETLLSCVHSINHRHVVTMSTQPSQIKQRLHAVIQHQKHTPSLWRKTLVLGLSSTLLIGCVDWQLESYVDASQMVDLVGYDLPSLRSFPDRGEVMMSVFYDGKDEENTHIRFKLKNGEHVSWLTLGPLKKFNEYIHTWHFQLKNQARFTGEYEIIGVIPDGVIDGVAVGLLGTDLDGQFNHLKSKSNQASEIINILCSWPLALPYEEIVPVLPQITENNPDSVRRLLCGAQLVDNGLHQLN